MTTASDLGSTMRFVVTGKNAYGTAVGSSAIGVPVVMMPPHVKGRRIVGTSKAEYLAGSGYDDTILGKGGNDTLLGGAGSDTIEGGDGRDVVIGGTWVDRLYGNDGSDTIIANDGERDTIDCGDRGTTAPSSICRTTRAGVQVIALGAGGSTQTSPTTPAAPGSS